MHNLLVFHHTDPVPCAQGAEGLRVFWGSSIPKRAEADSLQDGHEPKKIRGNVT